MKSMLTRVKHDPSNSRVRRYLFYIVFLISLIKCEDDDQDRMEKERVTRITIHTKERSNYLSGQGESFSPESGLSPYQLCSEN